MQKLGLALAILAFLTLIGTVVSKTGVAPTLLASQDPGVADFARVADMVEKYVGMCHIYAKTANPHCRELDANFSKDEFGRRLDELVNGEILADGTLLDANDLRSKVTYARPLQYKGRTIYGGFVEFRAHLQDRRNERYVDTCHSLSFIHDIEFDKVWDFQVGDCSAATAENRAWRLGS